MAVVLAAGEDNRRTRNALKVTFGIGLCQRSELVDDRFHISVSVAFAEKIRKEMRQRRRTKRRAHIFERVGPAIVDALGRVIIDAPLGELFVWVVAGAGQD